MKIRMLTGTRVSANEHGTDDRYLAASEVHESSAPWETDLFERLVGAGLAAEADKTIVDIETKKIGGGRKKTPRKSTRRTAKRK